MGGTATHDRIARTLSYPAEHIAIWDGDERTVIITFLCGDTWCISLKEARDLAERLIRAANASERVDDKRHRRITNQEEAGNLSYD